MDYDKIIERCERGRAIKAWIESIVNEEDQAGLMCTFIDRMIFFENNDAQSVFLKALRMELETIDQKITQA